MGTGAHLGKHSPFEQLGLIVKPNLFILVTKRRTVPLPLVFSSNSHGREISSEQHDYLCKLLLLKPAGRRLQSWTK